MSFQFGSEILEQIGFVFNEYIIIIVVNDFVFCLLVIYSLLNKGL